MFLNETKPPLEEAVELAHYGVPGMKWGRRKGRDSSDALDDDDDFDYGELDRIERRERNKRVATGAALALVGAVAVGAVLHKTGAVKIDPELIAKGKEAASKASKLGRESPSEKSARLKDAFAKGQGAYAAYKNSPFAKRKFEPRNTGNPLWSRTNDNVGFGTGPKTPSQHVYDGSFRVHSMNDPNIWDMPMLALTSGRK